MITTVVSTVANITLGIIMTIFLTMVLERRFGKVLNFIITFAIVMGSLVAGLFFPDQSLVMIKLLISFAIMFCASLVCFKDKWQRKILAVGIIFLNEILCELLSMLFFPLSITPDVLLLAHHQQIIVYIIYDSLFALLSWAFIFILNRKAHHLGGRELITFALFPLSQAFIVMSSIAINPDAKLWSEILAVPICFVVDFGLYMVMRGMSQRAELKAINKQLAWQIEAQKEHYAALTAQFENIHMLRHDIAGHMHTIKAMIESGSIAESSSYAHELTQKYSLHPSLGKCENPIVDAFLYDCIKRAEQSNIKIETDITLPKTLSISNVDLISAFSNLFDNALETCTQAQESARFIRLFSTYKEGFLTIRMENTLSESNAHPTRIPGLKRGLGLHILDAIAKQYEGSFIAQPGDKYFCSILVMKGN